MKKISLILFAILLATSCKNNNNDTLKLRLKWQYQAQFAGYLIAQEKGFYDELGLEVEINSAGPDLKPYLTVASGSDDIGIGVPNQIVTAQSNDVPLVAIAQVMQDSPFRFVLKSENRIDSLAQLKGEKIGLWMGGDEAEFVSMLKTENLKLSDFQIIPQGFTVVPFLEDSYKLSHVSVYNELNQILANGYESDGALQVLNPADYDSDILGDLLFTTKSYAENNRHKISRFLEASYKGWRYAKDNPNEAIKIVLKFNPDLEKESQEKQLDAALALIFNQTTKENGFGYLSKDAFLKTIRILKDSKQIDKDVNVEDLIYDKYVLQFQNE